MNVKYNVHLTSNSRFDIQPKKLIFYMCSDSIHKISNGLQNVYEECFLIPRGLKTMLKVQTT